MFANCMQCGNHFLRADDQHWKLLCLDCYKYKKEQERIRKEYDHFRQQQWQQPQRPQQPFIEASMLRRLIYLCHPDKHKGSEASKLATTWLLEQKGKQ